MTQNKLKQKHTATRSDTLKKDLSDKVSSRLNVTSELPVRLNKYLALSGIASRRGADSLIKNKKVVVNGKHALLGTKVGKGDLITLFHEQAQLEYFLYYKPKGETTGILSAHPTLHPVGRLDKESEGLLLYTNDYRTTEALLHPSQGHERVYLVTVKEPTTPRISTILLRGIHTQEGKYSPAKKIDLLPSKHEIRIVLTEGKKHEVRRMLNALNLTVLRLVREKILFFTTRGLSPSAIRRLTSTEETKLLTVLKLT